MKIAIRGMFSKDVIFMSLISLIFISNHSNTKKYFLVCGHKHTYPGNKVSQRPTQKITIGLKDLI